MVITVFTCITAAGGVLDKFTKKRTEVNDGERGDTCCRPDSTRDEQTVFKSGQIYEYSAHFEKLIQYQRLLT